MEMKTHTMQRTPESDVSMKRPDQRFRCVLTIAAVLLCTIVAVPPIRASSAVATAINPKNGRLSFGYWKGGASESEARKRAMHYCVSMGWVNAKVIDSTSRKGYSAVVWFETADKRSHCAVSLAATTPQQAISSALRKAKAAGGRYAVVDATWYDISSTTRAIIKL